MSYLSTLKSSDLKQITKLLAKKESLLRKLQVIDTALDNLSGEVKPEKSASIAGTPKKRARRGKLKTKILAALKAAGEKGHTVAELAKILNTKPNNLYAWFYTTGKKTPGLKKSKDGRYSL